VYFPCIDARIDTDVGLYSVCIDLIVLLILLSHSVVVGSVCAGKSSQPELRYVTHYLRSCGQGSSAATHSTFTMLVCVWL